MRRVGFVLVLLLWSLTASVALADTMYIDAGSADRVHLRAEASVDSKSFGLYFSGAQVEVQGKVKDFTAVSIGTENGFIMSKYLKSDMEGVDSALRVGRVHMGAGYINMRRHAGESKVFMAVPDGEAVTVLGETANGWYCVEYGGATGYMKSSLVQLGGLAAQHAVLKESLIFDESGREIAARLYAVGGGKYEQEYRVCFSRDGKEVSAAGFTGDLYEYLRGYESDEGSPVMRLTDVNMDGHTDVSVITYRGATDAHAAHFLYDPASGGYVYDKRLNVLSWWRCDLYPKTRRMLNYARDGAACGTWTLYQWRGNVLEEIAVGRIRHAEQDGMLRATVFRGGGTVYTYEWNEQTEDEWQRQYDAIMALLLDGMDAGAKVPLAQSETLRGR